MTALTTTTITCTRDQLLLHRTLEPTPSFRNPQFSTHTRPARTLRFMFFFLFAFYSLLAPLFSFVHYYLLTALMTHLLSR